MIKNCHESRCNHSVEDLPMLYWKTHPRVSMAKAVKNSGIDQKERGWEAPFNNSQPSILCTPSVGNPEDDRRNQASRTPASFRFFPWCEAAVLIPTFWLASSMLWAMRRFSSASFLSRLSVLPLPLPLPWN